MCADMHAEMHAVLCCAVLPALLQGLKRAELRDELYMQLVKQTRSNPIATSRARAWALFHLVASAMPPSKEFTGLISEYVHTALQVSGKDRAHECGWAAVVVGKWPSCAAWESSNRP